MDNNKAVYEGDITLHRFFRAIKRNIVTILSFFLIFFIVGFAYVKVTTKQSYTSTGYIASSMENGNSISATAYQNIPNIVMNDECYNASVEALVEKGIKHSNGAPISYEDLYYGISSKTLDTLRVRCTYTSTDKLNVQNVLDVVMETAISIGNDDKYNTLYRKSLIVITQAESVVKAPNNSKVMYLLFAFVGLALGVAAAVIHENSRDTIYSSVDFNELGITMFPLHYENENNFFIKKKNHKQFFDNSLNDKEMLSSMILLQNQLAIYGDKKPMQVVALTTPRSNEDFILFVKAFAEVYSMDGKTILIDLDPYKTLLNDLYPLSEEQKGLSIETISEFSSLIIKHAEKLDLLHIEKMNYPYELFNTDEFETMISELRKEYKHIVLISPSWVENQDISLLKNEIDGLLMFTIKNKTRREDIVNCIKNFESLNVPYVGTIFLNLK